MYLRFVILFFIITDLLGCFKDQRSRTLNGGKTVSKSMTLEKCQLICEKKNTKYFGLEVQIFIIHYPNASPTGQKYCIFEMLKTEKI